MKDKNIPSRFYKPYVLGHWVTQFWRNRIILNPGLVPGRFSDAIRSAQHI